MDPNMAKKIRELEGRLRAMTDMVADVMESFIELKMQIPIKKIEEQVAAKERWMVTESIGLSGERSEIFLSYMDAAENLTAATEPAVLERVILYATKGISAYPTESNQGE